MDRLRRRTGSTSAGGGAKEKSPSITIDGTAPIGLTQEEERTLKELWKRAEAEEREELLAQVSACSERQEADEDERAATALQALYRGHSTRSHSDAGWDAPSQQHDAAAAARGGGAGSGPDGRPQSRGQRISSRILSFNRPRSFHRRRTASDVGSRAGHGATDGSSNSSQPSSPLAAQDGSKLSTRCGAAPAERAESPRRTQSWL